MLRKCGCRVLNVTQLSFLLTLKWATTLYVTLAVCVRLLVVLADSLLNINPLVVCLFNSMVTPRLRLVCATRNWLLAGCRSAQFSVLTLCGTTDTPRIGLAFGSVSVIKVRFTLRQVIALCLPGPRIWPCPLKLVMTCLTVVAKLRSLIVWVPCWAVVSVVLPIRPVRLVLEKLAANVVIRLRLILSVRAIPPMRIPRTLSCFPPLGWLISIRWLK